MGMGERKGQWYRCACVGWDRGAFTERLCLWRGRPKRWPVRPRHRVRWGMQYDFDTIMINLISSAILESFLNATPFTLTAPSPSPLHHTHRAPHRHSTSRKPPSVPTTLMQSSIKKPYHPAPFPVAPKFPLPPSTPSPRRYITITNPTPHTVLRCKKQNPSWNRFVS